MERQSEMPKSSEQILTEKKEKLINAVDLMMDWQKSKRIKETLLSQLDKLTNEEIDYCLTRVRYSNNQVQLRGPFASSVKEMLIEDEAELKEMKKIIGSERAEELNFLI